MNPDTIGPSPVPANAEHRSQKSVSSVLDCTTGLTSKIEVKNGIDYLKLTN
jgi:hypothetical protein